jgi:hypothetical protein
MDIEIENSYSKFLTLQDEQPFLGMVKYGDLVERFVINKQIFVKIRRDR